jgi:hypothetical protein
VCVDPTCPSQGVEALLLVGDPRQLPATVVSQAAQAAGLQVSPIVTLASPYLTQLTPAKLQSVCVTERSHSRSLASQARCGPTSTTLTVISARMQLCKQQRGSWPRGSWQLASEA